MIKNWAKRVMGRSTPVSWTSRFTAKTVPGSASAGTVNSVVQPLSAETARFSALPSIYAVALAGTHQVAFRVSPSGSVAEPLRETVSPAFAV